MTKTTNFHAKSIAGRFGKIPLLLKYVGHPSLLRFLGTVRGQHILDVGCGTGIITSELGKRGAHASGIDTSKTFIDVARARFPSQKFTAGNGAKLGRFRSRSFHKVILSMVLVNVSSRRDFKGIFKESARVLRNGGELIILAIHPLVIRNFEDKLRRVKLPANRTYSSQNMIFENHTLLSDSSNMHFVNKHWSLEDIANELRANEMVITEIKEPKPRKGKHWRELKDALSTPHYLLIRAEKRAIGQRTNKST